jgi:hypothetical protein
VRLRLFSPNEALKEVHDEHLGFLLTPALLAQATEACKGDRLAHLLHSRQYLEAFLNVLRHYECEEESVFPPALQKYYQSLLDPAADPAAQRTLMIANEKSRAALAREVPEEARLEGWRRHDRPLLLSLLVLEAHEAVKSIKLGLKEAEMLRHQKKITSSEEERAKFEEEMSRPIPKLKYWRLEKQEQPGDSLATQLDKMDIVSTSLATTRQEKLGLVFRENPNQPTVTLDELDEMEYQNFKKREAHQKKMAELTKQDSDSDKEEVDDRKKKEARKWDEFTDANEKGIGNRGNR